MNPSARGLLEDYRSICRNTLKYSDTDLGAQGVVNLLVRIEHEVFPG